MNSSLISKIEKAKRYAQEPDRIQIRGLDVEFRGDNGTHKVRLSGDEWSCECDHFQVHGLCAHVMTLQRIFSAHLSDAVRYTQERTPATA
ncbi:MAG TPA: SWIM zinc finger family protein [Candidatus Limnocylindria bacterium]